jgi:hypothetical protein
VTGLLYPPSSHCSTFKPDLETTMRLHLHGQPPWPGHQHLPPSSAATRSPGTSFSPFSEDIWSWLRSQKSPGPLLPRLCLDATIMHPGPMAQVHLQFSHPLLSLICLSPIWLSPGVTLLNSPHLPCFLCPPPLPASVREDRCLPCAWLPGTRTV